MLKLTRPDGVKIVVSIRHIVAIHPTQNPPGSYIETVNDVEPEMELRIKVKESIEQIGEMHAWRRI